MLTIEEIRAACARSEPVQFGDPYLSQIKMPLRETFYPLGFPLQIETNCEEVLNSAAASWQGFVKLFDTPPIRVRVNVSSGRSSDCPPTPVSRIQQHLVSNVADSENFSTADISQGFAHNLAHRSGRRQSRLSSLLLSGIHGDGSSRHFARYGDSRCMC